MRFFIAALILLTTCGSIAQSTQDTIVIREHGNIYMLNDQVLTLPDLISLTSDNPQAYDEIWKAKSNSEVANVFAILGGALVGWPLGTAIGGGDPQWELAGIGAGLIAIAIPFATTASKQTTRAIKLYNEGIKLNAEKNITLKAGIYNDGVGFCLKF